MSDTTNDRDAMVRCQQCGFTRDMRANCADGNFTDFCESCGRLTIHLISEAVPLAEHKRALAFHAETMAERNRLLRQVEDLQARLFNKDVEITRLNGQVEQWRAEAEIYGKSAEMWMADVEDLQRRLAEAVVRANAEPE